MSERPGAPGLTVGGTAPAVDSAPARRGQRAPGDRADLVHVTTVPMSLNFLRGQVRYMRDRGLRVHAISSPGPELTTFAEQEGAGTTAVSMPRRITPLRDLAAIRRVRREFRSLKPLIVHAHTPKGGLLGMLAATLAGVPVRIYHIRGLPFMGASGWRRQLLRATEWVSCRLAHRVLCVSHSIRETAVQEGLCGPDKIVVLLGGSGNGVDASGKFDHNRYGTAARTSVRKRVGIPENAFVIGFVGRIVRDKGIVELAEAWRGLRERHPELHLLMVGFFEEQDPVPSATAKLLREDPRVHLTGLDWDVAPYYAAMDLVVLPTYREGFPNVPLEAAAMRLAVVATRIPGCIDAVVDNVTGTLVPPRDARALGDAIEHYLADPDLRGRHAAAARDRVLTLFRQEAIWDALLREYHALLEARAAGAYRGPIWEPQT